MTFFGVSTGMGGLFTIASYSNFNSNIFLDSVVVSVIYDGRKQNIFFTCNHCNTNITEENNLLLIAMRAWHEVPRTLIFLPKKVTVFIFLQLPVCLQALPSSQFSAIWLTSTESLSQKLSGKVRGQYVPLLLNKGC